MEKSIMMDAVATAAQAAAHAALVRPAPRARAPYEAPGLQAVDLGRVLAEEFVYQSDGADLPEVDGSGLGLSDD